MLYMLMPLDRHFDRGFGAMADAFKNAADALETSEEASAKALNGHLPISFLYRHSIELYLKSAIIIFHRKFKLPYGPLSYDGEPHVLMETKWKPLYRIHALQPLYSYFRKLFADHAEYLSAHTGTDWTFPDELSGWIQIIEATDPTSTFFRYPITANRDKDASKSDIQPEAYDHMLETLSARPEPLKAFLMVDENDQVIESFSHNPSAATANLAALKEAAEFLFCCHAGLVGELTGGQ
jgi:hypothetical protein